MASLRANDEDPTMTERSKVTLYTRANCSLCDKAKEAVRAGEKLLGAPITLREVDVDGDPALRALFTNDVPVVYCGDQEAFRHRVDPAAFAELVRSGAVPGRAEGLAGETCLPCRGGVPPLAGEELDALARELGGGWRVAGGHHLEKEFRFPDFAAALAFTNRIGAVAEEQGHHPDIALSWGKVGVTIWTHKIDGLTRSDFVLAAKIDALEG
jgi:4a-hydroxytetrahydrobiopterin dehydratase